MANYICSARSNYFKVGEPKAFIEWINQFDGVYFEERNNEPEATNMVGALFCEDSDGGGWPCYVWDEETETDRDVDFFKEFSQFLAPDSVAVFVEVGSEKLRYLVGYACAVNHKGEIIQISLTDIFKRISEEWGFESINTEGV